MKWCRFPILQFSQSNNQTSLPIQSPWIWEHDLMAWPGVSIKYASLTCKLFGFCSLYIVMINLCCWKDCSVNLQYSKHHEFNHMSTEICHGSILWYDMLIPLFVSICNFGNFPLYQIILHINYNNFNSFSGWNPAEYHPGVPISEGNGLERGSGATPQATSSNACQEVG